jgi:hypothetical protein
MQYYALPQLEEVQLAVPKDSSLDQRRTNFKLIWRYELCELLQAQQMSLCT